MPKDLGDLTERAREEVVSRVELRGMSLLEHLEELRKRIIYSALASFAGFCICFWYHEELYELIHAPLSFALKNNHLDPQLLLTYPTSPFNMYRKMALVGG